MRSFLADFPAALALGPQSAWNQVPKRPEPRPEDYFKRWIQKKRDGFFQRESQQTNSRDKT